MSNADQVSIAYAPETVFGVTPATPTLKELRITSEGLKQAQTLTPSAEIRSDRQITDVIRTDANGLGDIGFELSYGAYDDLLAAALCSAGWSSPVTIGPIATLSAASADNSFNDSGNGLAGVVANQWIKVTGFTTPANNGYFKIVSKTAGKIVVKGATDLVVEAAGGTRTIIMGAQIVNGITFTSYVLERAHTDLANIFVLFNGFAIDAFSLSVTSDAIITGTIGWMGSRESSTVATVGTGTNTPAPTNDVMAAVDDITALMEAATYDPYEATEFTLALANNLRQRKRIGALGPISLGMGTINLTGTLGAYFATHAAPNKYLGDTPSALSIIAEDDLGQSYVVDVPTVRYTDLDRGTGGQNQDVMANLSWMAKRHPTEGITLRIARFAA